MKFVIAKSRSKVAQETLPQDDLLNRAIAPSRGYSKDPDRYRRDLNKLQQLAAIPPVIDVDGRLVVQKQKIAILSEDEIRELKTARVGGKPVDVRVVRVSDCPNPDDEFDRPTYSVLLTFSELSAEEIARNRFSREGELAPTTQSNNFVLSDKLPGSKPSPPIQDEGDTAIGKSDFQAVDPIDLAQYPEQSKLIVAAVDSGAKFDLANRPNTSLYEYTTRKGLPQKLGLVRGLTICGIEPGNIGYCGVGSYLNPPVPTPSTLQVLTTLSDQQITASAFDDSPGRHGTYVTAIINQESSEAIRVLPVKAFNWAGYGTLFDLLCALNYVLEQKRRGLPIVVLNASWVGSVDEEGRYLLFSKFKQLEKAGIIVIAAAGNQGRDLSRMVLYPACFSTELNNIITVTSVEPTFRPILLGAVGDKFSDLVTADGKDNILDHLGLNNKLFDLFLRGFKVVGNYSNKYVSVGVFGRRWSGYRSPFHREDPLLARTSYATAYVSGHVATYLHDKGIIPTADKMAELRDVVLAAIAPTEPSLVRTIKQGRMLKVNP